MLLFGRGGLISFGLWGDLVDRIWREWLAQAVQKMLGEADIEVNKHAGVLLAGVLANITDFQAHERDGVICADAGADGEAQVCIQARGNICGDDEHAAVVGVVDGGDGLCCLAFGGACNTGAKEAIYDKINLAEEFCDQGVKEGMDGDTVVGGNFGVDGCI